jgi:stage V sporulation protein SpoVS
MAAGSWLPFWLSFWGQPVNLSGQISEGETAFGTLTIERHLSSQATETEAATSAALSRNVNLSATCSSGSTATGTLQITKPLTGQISESQNTTGQLEISRLLTAQVHSHQTVTTGSLTIARELSGLSSAGQEIVTASLTLSRYLVGQGSAIEAASGQLQVSRTLTIVITSYELDQAALLLITRYLSGPVVNEIESGAGELDIGASGVRLSGQISQVSSASGHLLITRDLTGQATALETLTTTAFSARPAVAIIVILDKSRGGIELLEGASATLAALPGAVTLIEVLAKATGAASIDTILKAVAITQVMVKAKGQPLVIGKAGSSLEVMSEALGLIELLAKAGIALIVEDKSEAGIVEMVGAGAGATATIETGS